MNHDQDIRSARYVQRRTLLLGLLPLLLPMIYMIIVVPLWHRNALHGQALRRAEGLATLLAANAAPQVDFEDTTALENGLGNALHDEEAIYAQVFGAEGKLLAEKGELKSAVQFRRIERYQVLEEGDSIIHVAAPIKRGPTRLGQVHLAISTKQVDSEANRFVWLAIVLTLMVLAISGAISMLLGRSFTRLFAQLRQSILETATKVDQAVSGLAAVSSQQTSAAAEESSALMETNASATTLGQGAAANSQRASLLIEGGKRAEEDAAAGLSSAGTATAAMREVREQMNAIATTIGAFSERAATIGDINATVALLAERSNLLALNAAIEAARAGSQGRGFSVVANEMRALADGSNRSAGQVKAIISEIQSAISKAVSEVREGERRVQNAEELMGKSGDSIRRFVDSTREFANLGREIAAAASEQSSAIEQMIDSIANATQAGGTQLETTKQVEETARQLRRMSHQLLHTLRGTSGASHDASQEPADEPGGANESAA